MSRIICRGALLLVAGAMAVALASTPAAAQEEPAITVVPGSIEAAGDVEFTVTGTGWDFPMVGLVGCRVPESGDPDDMGPTDCFIDQIVETEPVDGRFELRQTWPVGDRGLFVIVTSADDPVSPTATVLHQVEIMQLPETGAEHTLLATLAAALILFGGLMVRISSSVNQNDA